MRNLAQGDVSHVALKSVLPELKNMLHDMSEKVQIQFIELMSRVKTLRNIRVCVSVGHKFILKTYYSCTTAH